jgi:ribosomal subunit interface protein
MNMNSSPVQNVARPNARELRVDPSRNGRLDILTRGDGIDVSEQLRSAVVQKIGRVRQYAPRAFRVRVQFHKDRAKPSPDQYRVTVHYEVPGNDVLAEHSAHDPFTALDVVSEKIERRLRKRKTARLARRLARKTRSTSAFRYETINPVHN